MSEEEWIRKNIQQRMCHVFCRDKSLLSDEELGSILELMAKSLLSDEELDSLTELLVRVQSLLSDGELDSILELIYKAQRCKCWRSLRDHPGFPDLTKKADVWSVSKNTIAEPCRHFGTIPFANGKSSKFVRLDLETRMSVVQTLLLDVWKLPDPTWIISVMGDPDDHAVNGLAKENELVSNIKTAMSLFSNGNSMWVIAEGINFGVSKLIGQTLKIDRQNGNISLVGIFDWGSCFKMFETLEKEKSLQHNPKGNCPSVLYPHHLLVDDGSINPGFTNKSVEDFRTLLETSLTNHSDEGNKFVLEQEDVLDNNFFNVKIHDVSEYILTPSSESTSMPLVILLHSGWIYVIDGIVSAIENNVPIVVLKVLGLSVISSMNVKGTGGFADVLASVYETSKEDPINTSTTEHGRKWTGTIIDDRLRKDVRERFKEVHGEAIKDGLHKLLQCLQKRELITIVNLDDDRKSLAKAIIRALLKTKTTTEILRIIDNYMSSRMFEGQGTLTAAWNDMSVDGEGLNEVASMFLFEAMKLDLSELVQFIIDYEDVNVPTFIEENKENFSKGEESDPFKILLQWAVRSGRQNCAALFWKKGNDLLASALGMADELQAAMNTEENIGEKRDLQKHSILFQQRALGLLDECYNDDRRKTMLLIQSQGKGNIWTERTSNNSGSTSNHVLDKCFVKCNRRIFARDAFQRYMEQVWYGKINPPEMGTSKRQKDLNIEMESNPDKIKRICLAPVTTYILNLVFYVAFLVLFAHTLLFELEKKYSPLEGILVFWWLTFVVEEVRQFWNTSAPGQKNSKICERFAAKLKGHFLDSYWNILDFACLFLFLVGGVLMAVYHIGASRGDVYKAARMFLSLDIMLFTLRLMQFFAMSSSLGPILVMMYQMVKDLLPFLAVMLVFIVSQGLAAHALLYPNRNWSPQAFLYVPKYAYWNIFGELGLDEIEEQEPNDCSSDPLLNTNETMAECRSSLGQYVVPFFLGMYMLLMNVLLLNIIIARFSFTFNTIHEQTTWIAAWQRARIILEYYMKPPLPPPFNIFFHLGQLFSYRCTRNSNIGDNKGLERKEDPWERTMAERYLASAEFKSGSERISFRKKKETKYDQPIPQRISSPTDPSTSQAQETANERPPILTEEMNKRFEKLERMLEEIIRNSS